jgi:hypothetical protein
VEIKLFNHIVDAYYGELNINDTKISHIATNTVETWQPNRESKELANNIKQGKIAEEIVEQFLSRFFSNRISLKSYDEIRNDGFTKHAPFDLLIWENGMTDITPIELEIQNDIAKTPDKFVRLSEYTRKLCRQNNVKIVEVKSTKIRDKLKKDSGFNGDYDDSAEILKLVNEIKSCDDVFCYPHFKRSDVTKNYSIDDYCQLVKKQDSSLANLEGEQLRRRVIDIELYHQCSDIFVRVYIDQIQKRGFVIGWIKRERLLDYSVNFKRMVQRNKSERALYFTKNLMEVEGLDQIHQVFDSKSCVFASPYTRTNFYHKKKDCQFIRKVSQNDLIIFETEEAAKANGRYTRRCSTCFED